MSWMSGFPIRVAYRQTFSRGTGRSAPVVTMTGILGLALAVAILVVVSAVMNGFERELRQRVLGLVPHLTVSPRTSLLPWQEVSARLERIPGVLAVAPVAEAPVIVTGATGLRGAKLRGIEPASQQRASILGQFAAPIGLAGLQPGRWETLIGAELAAQLGIVLGDQVLVTLPTMTPTPLGTFARQRRFKVIGLLDTGTSSDARLLVAHLQDVQRLLRLGPRVTSLHVRSADVFRTWELEGPMYAALEGHDLRIRDWSWTHGPIYQAIVLQKRMLFILLSLLIAVAAFNVVSALVMAVRERRPQIAILQSLGATRWQLATLFGAQGLMMCALGVGAGMASGVVLALLLPSLAASIDAARDAPLLQQYFIDYLPVELRVPDLLTIAGASLLIVLLAVLYPALRAAAVPAAEVLRDE